MPSIALFYESYQSILIQLFSNFVVFVYIFSLCFCYSSLRFKRSVSIFIFVFLVCKKHPINSVLAQLFAATYAIKVRITKHKDNRMQKKNLNGKYVDRRPDNLINMTNYIDAQLNWFKVWFNVLRLGKPYTKSYWWH